MSTNEFKQSTRRMAHGPSLGLKDQVLKGNPSSLTLALSIKVAALEVLILREDTSRFLGDLLDTLIEARGDRNVIGSTAMHVTG
eukprot:6348715-Amphidinium_carterae.1